MAAKKKEIDYSQVQLEALDGSQQELIEKAREALNHAYAPYSNFKVGAAVLLDNGEVITGSNQENAAYPSGLCAERVALFSAHHLYPNAKVKALAIAAADKGVELKNPIMPCGACVQVMSESITRSGCSFQVLLYGSSRSYVLDDARDLLPFRFEL